jgi:hypothetical protein
MLDAKTKEALKKHGFEPCSYVHDIMAEVYSYSPGLDVEGDHATDVLEILYTEVDGFQGLCYGSSLLERLGGYGVAEPIVKKIEKYLVDLATFRRVSCGYYFAAEITPDNPCFMDYVAEMIKGAVVLDYFCSRQMRKIEREWRREAKKKEKNT